MNTYILTIQNKQNIIDKFAQQRLKIEQKNIVMGKEDHLNTFQFDDIRARLLYDFELSQGMKNCASGHRKIWAIAKSDHPQAWVQILEDDALLDLNYAQGIERLISLKVDFPLAIILGHSKTVQSNVWFENLKWPIYEEFRHNGVALGEKTQNLFGTVGYLLNNHAVTLLDTLPAPFWKPDDWSCLKNYGLKVYHLRNPLIWEDFLCHSSNTGSSTQIQHDIYSFNLIREFGSMVKSQIIYRSKNKIANK
jgi:GR25 family glycosyltransferase involved in LPS biosynthesis